MPLHFVTNYEQRIAIPARLPLREPECVLARVGEVLLIRPEYLPVPPRCYEDLERGPAHGRTQPAVHRAGGLGDIMQPVAHHEVRADRARK